MKKQIMLAGLTLALLSTGAHAADSAQVSATKHANLLGYTKFPQRDGEALYKAVCAGCHMPDGKGGTGAGFYPALADNGNLAAWAYPALLILNGSKAMPSFRAEMDDEQITAVVTYIRTKFGNKYDDPVPPDELKALREAK
ncbi:c-type cytochrome [Niveispirillum sp. KHB5.9]|uniref:c-type cytochrome n=1 Tax=Niveispirillum sp. KHB5.9 TaxID=3400269 RepID=UPI003A86EE44